MNDQQFPDGPGGIGHSVPGQENVRLVGSTPNGQLLAVWPMTGDDDGERVRVRVSDVVDVGERVRDCV